MVHRLTLCTVVVGYSDTLRDWQKCHCKSVTDCHCNSSYKMTHIEAESINIWLRYDPKCNLAICKDSGVKYELRKQLTSVKLSKKSISRVNFDI